MSHRRTAGHQVLVIGHYTAAWLRSKEVEEAGRNRGSDNGSLIVVPHVACRVLIPSHLISSRLRPSHLFSSPSHPRMAFCGRWWVAVAAPSSSPLCFKSSSTSSCGACSLKQLSSSHGCTTRYDGAWSGGRMAPGRVVQGVHRYSHEGT